MTSMGTGSISRCSYVLLAASCLHSRADWYNRKRPLLWLCCYQPLSKTVPVLSLLRYWATHWRRPTRLPGDHESGYLPQSALSGCRLSTAGICLRELHGTPEQELSRNLWPSRATLREWDHGSGLTLRLRVCLVDATWLLCLARAVYLQSHLLRPAPTHLSTLISALQGMHLTRHHPQMNIQPCHVLFERPRTKPLWLPRISHLDKARLAHPSPMGRAHYRPDGTRRRTRGELEARAKKKAQREREAAEAAAAAAAPLEEAEPGPVWPDRREEEEEAKVEIEVEVEEEVEELPVRRRPKAKLRPAPKWGAANSEDYAGQRDRSRSPHRVAVSAERLFRLSKALTRLLRHKAAEEGLPLREDGFFEVEALVHTREMRSHGARSAEILYAIQQDAKKRYTLRHFDGVPWVRAAQGHSQSVRKDLVMRRLRRRELPPYFVPRNSVQDSAWRTSCRRPLWVPDGYSPGGASPRFWPESPVRLEVQL